MIHSFLATLMPSRVSDGRRWRIEHDATHLSITILLPDTDPPAVTWLLPNGQRIEGNVIDADVPAGETLCLCEDFSRCGIDMEGCESRALHINCAEMPVLRPRLHNIRGRCGYYRDVRYNTPAKVAHPGETTAIQPVGAGVIRIKYSENLPSSLIMSVEDINHRKSYHGSGRYTHTHLEIGYVPNFTGDLADLNILTQHWYRVPDADFTSYEKIDGVASNMIYVMQHTIIHHTGVHGHCDFSNASPGHFGFYGNPNMTPDDYDQTVITLAAGMQSLKNQNALDQFMFDPDDFILDISSRRTSMSDEAVAALREMGMIVNEMDDTEE